MMAVECILEYRDLEPEKEPVTPRAVPVEWPMGESHFDLWYTNILILFYDSHIVGRTGVVQQE